MSIKWVKEKKTVNEEGTTIVYMAADDPSLTIESRKRHIPHAGGRGDTWDHTSYFVLTDGKEVIEKQSLADAKRFAEGLR